MTSNLDRPIRLVQLFDSIINETTHEGFCDINLPLATQTFSDLISQQQSFESKESTEQFEGFMMLYEAFRPLAKSQQNVTRVENLLS